MATSQLEREKIVCFKFTILQFSLINTHFLLNSPHSGNTKLTTNMTQQWGSSNWDVLISGPHEAELVIYFQILGLHWRLMPKWEHVLRITNLLYSRLYTKEQSKHSNKASINTFN